MDIQSIELEFRDAPIGDSRRSARLERIGVDLARDPALSFPAAMETEWDSPDFVHTGVMRPRAA